ncbi:MAG: bifunctional folylpolyglutamate synthase/dihydrofolate synthase [Veillonella sp.]|uniref:bifunctional folylpolyglutamate synthase/dihydrofolate synthase n=1 Tax=Veillonella sp. TaxID=1926307 RepID=UPI0025D90F1B|nr:folylpolyglutamate synthase/dihydrofolate synthase family protein [Veillonella sp.]MBS4914125.1 bifunctional folylpolyglutamate synthase/dihydrofolate synthase [Veillonella sp.]
MTYEEAIAYLEQSASFGIKPGLERIERLLQALGNPEKAYKIVHVTGTNGKGSVTSFIASALTESGYRVGRFTSPHLARYTERFCIDGADICDDTFIKLVETIQPAVAKLVATGMESPTQFELLTAMGFLCFKEAGVDYAVVEVGLGGLLDSTNVVMPEVAVITNVTIDHQAYCGRTIPEIATHKAGIIKPGRPVVTTATGEALDVITKTAESKKSPIRIIDVPSVIKEVSHTDAGQSITVAGYDRPFITALRGVYQSANLVCALGALKVLQETDSAITDEAVYEGIRKTVWPGRFEVVQALDRIFIFDGAHNRDGAEAFDETYRAWYGTTPKTMVMAILKDKEVDSMIGYLVKSDDTVFTVPAPTPRSSEPEELARAIGRGIPMQSVGDGLSEAMKVTGHNDIIAVAGSLYILGEAKAWLKTALHNVQ